MQGYEPINDTGIFELPPSCFHELRVFFTHFESYTETHLYYDDKCVKLNGRKYTVRTVYMYSIVTSVHIPFNTQ